tara:strand:- start:13574 stop:14287 length:714 start_codon:yes stop_codon:yes gene_type:complete
MNWYKRFKLAQVRGEFWIHSGQAWSADGDVNDVNHEGMVRDSILGKYDMDYESNLVDIEDPSFIEDFVRNEFEECVDLLLQQGNLSPEEAQAYLEDPVTNHEEVVSLISIGDILKIKGASDDEIEVIEAGDARLFAMKAWGWKRLEGIHVETWTLTNEDLSQIADGLYDAYQEEAETVTYTIHVHSTGKVLNMTWEQISKREIAQQAPLDTERQEAYEEAFKQQDKPSSGFYSDYRA